MSDRLLKTAFVYAVAGMLSGAFYREFTKFTDFTGDTVLSVTHTHLIILGVFLFLILFLFEKQFEVSKEKMFIRFYIFFNLGLILKIITMYARGIIQVLGLEISGAINGSIAGIAGVSHIILAISIIMLYLTFKKVIITGNK